MYFITYDNGSIKSQQIYAGHIYNGSSSVDAYKVNNRQELDAILTLVRNPMVQDYMDGIVEICQHGSKMVKFLNQNLIYLQYTIMKMKILVKLKQ